MKASLRIGVFCLGGLLLGGHVLGEVRVSLRLEHRSTLQYEPVRAYLSFYNDSDYAYVIDSGNDAARLSRFSIEIRRAADRSLVETASPPVRYLYLMPDEREEVLINLTSHYRMAAMGRYTVKAVTSHHGESYASTQSLLDVVRGIEVAKTVRSIPNYPGLLRSYVLRRWPRGGGAHLFLSVDETDGEYNCGVFDLGPLIHANDPAVQADRNGNVVVVHQCEPDCFIRTSLKSTRDGVALVDQTYHLPDGSPYPRGGEASLPSPPPPKPAKRWWQFWKWGRS